MIGCGRLLWRAIRYVTNDRRFKPCDGEYASGSEFWEDYNFGRKKKYSYSWCLEFEKTGKGWWNELFMADPYLKVCCDKKKIRSLDQLLYYSEEYWSRKY